MSVSLDQILLENKSLSDSISVSLLDSLLIIFLSVCAGFYLKFIFKRYSNSYSSTKAFGNTLLMVTLAVSSLIAVVKSSLALSLGLVGALSVVRFRTAVKEPYNLAFILLSICIGISIGASQYTFALLITIVGSLVAIYAFKSDYGKNEKIYQENLDVINITLPSQKSLTKLLELLGNLTDFYSINTLSSNSQNNLVVSLSIKIEDQQSLNKIMEILKTEFKDCNITFYNRPES